MMTLFWKIFGISCVSIEQGGQPQAVILKPRQGLAFPGVEYIKDKVMKHGVYEQPPNAVILYASHFAICDYTMVQGISQLCDYFSKHKLHFVIAECEVNMIYECRYQPQLNFIIFVLYFVYFISIVL